jgi:hypothetical protein
MVSAWIPNYYSILLLEASRRSLDNMHRIICQGATFLGVKRHMRATYRFCEAHSALLTCSASDFGDIQALLSFAQRRARRCRQMARYFSSYRYSSLWYRCVVVVSSACA